MATPTHHLAQLNVARLLAPLDSPQVADFVAALDPVNELADSAPGFVWRLQTDAGDATAVRVWDDDRIIVNMSVWESVEALREFVYGSDHVEVMRRRREWFAKMAQAFMVLWWIPAATVPTVAEGTARLAQLEAHGPTPDAFTFRAWFAPPGQPAERHGQ
jgi:heme-degrading monooxygenase HmoA